MKLFIADDSIILQERLTNLIADIENISIVGTATNAVEAKRKIKNSKPDLVITDIRMPGGSGMDLLSDIKENHPDIVVIVYTNYPYPQYKNKCLTLGAEYFFQKSTESDKLIDTIEEIGLGNLQN